MINIQYLYVLGKSIFGLMCPIIFFIRVSMENITDDLDNSYHKLHIQSHTVRLYLEPSSVLSTQHMNTII